MRDCDIFHSVLYFEDLPISQSGGLVPSPTAVLSSGHGVQTPQVSGQKDRTITLLLQRPLSSTQVVGLDKSLQVGTEKQFDERICDM